MKKVFVLLYILLLIKTTIIAREYEFIFSGFTEKNIRVKWEIFENTPTGFTESNEFSFKQGTDVFKKELKKNQKIRFEAYAIENPRKISLVETRSKDQLDKTNKNLIVFNIFEKIDPRELLSLPQMIIKIAQDKFAKGLLKEKNEMILDTDLPTGTLIFYDGTTSFYRPTTGIIDKEIVDENLNKYNYKLEDMIKIEQSLTIGASTSQLGFLKNLSVGVDLSDSKFFEFKIEINNLSKRQANTYLSDPFNIFNYTHDRWLESAYNVINRSQEKSKYKLYFVTSRIMSDAVYLRRRVFKEFTGDISMLVDGGSLVQVEAGAKQYSLARFEKLDSISNYYVDYEVIDMSFVMLNEATKFLTSQQVNAVKDEKSRVFQKIDDSKTKLLDNYNLLKCYSELPQNVTSVNQVISICENRVPELEKSYKLDSLGNEIINKEFQDYNKKVRDYNSYLKIIQNEILNYRDLLGLNEAIINRLWKLENNMAIEPTEAERKQTSLEAKVLKNMDKGTPK